MKRETLYKIAVIVLLAVNVVQISALFLTKRPPDREQRPRDGKPDAVSILQLDTIQNKKFKEFSEQHHRAMSRLQQEQKRYVEDYFIQPSDSLLNSIKEIEVKKIETLEKHFEDMKSVLEDDQLPYYGEFKDKAVKYILK